MSRTQVKAVPSAKRIGNPEERWVAIRPMKAPRRLVAGRVHWQIAAIAMASGMLGLSCVVIQPTSAVCFIWYIIVSD